MMKAAQRKPAVADEKEKALRCCSTEEPEEGYCVDQLYTKNVDKSITAATECIIALTTGISWIAVSVFAADKEMWGTLGNIMEIAAPFVAVAGTGYWTLRAMEKEERAARKRKRGIIPPERIRETLEEEQNMRKRTTPIGARLYQLRKEKNWNLSQAAEAYAVRTQAVSAYETGANRPAIAVLCRIADVHSVSVDWILGRTDERRIPR